MKFTTDFDNSLSEKFSIGIDREQSLPRSCHDYITLNTDGILASVRFLSLSARLLQSAALKMKVNTTVFSSVGSSQTFCDSMNKM